MIFFLLFITRQQDFVNVKPLPDSTTEYVSDSNSSTSSIQYPALSSATGDVESITYQAKTKKWSKYHSCVFCEKKVIKMARH